VHIRSSVLTRGLGGSVNGVYFGDTRSSSHQFDEISQTSFQQNLKGRDMKIPFLDRHLNN
jgi:hypothetical protein